MNSGFQCCFCGKSISDKDLVDMVIYPSIDKTELQHIFSHKKCLREKLHESVLLHPDLED